MELAILSTEFLPSVHARGFGDTIRWEQMFFQSFPVPVRLTCGRCPAVLLGLRMTCWRERHGAVACWPFVHAPYQKLVEGTCLLEIRDRKQRSPSAWATFEGNGYDDIIHEYFPICIGFHTNRTAYWFWFKRLSLRNDTNTFFPTSHHVFKKNKISQTGLMFS